MVLIDCVQNWDLLYLLSLMVTYSCRRFEVAWVSDMGEAGQIMHRVDVWQPRQKARIMMDL